MRFQALRTACFAAALLLTFGAQIQHAQGQEDCFNDDHRLTRNDLEPPAAAMPALSVSDQDISRVLASIAERERRASTQSGESQGTKR